MNKFTDGKHNRRQKIAVNNHQADNAKNMGGNVQTSI